MRYWRSGAQRFAGSRRAFREDIVSVGAQQQFQGCDLISDRLSLAGVGNAARRIEDAHRMDFRDNIGSLRDCLADRLEMVVLGEIGSICVEDEREAFVAVNFGKGTIDGNSLVAGLDARD